MSRYADSHATSYAEVTDWRDLAACRTADPEIFYADAKDLASQHDRERAKTICRGCPSREPCLADALSMPPAKDQWGIRGGLDEKERAALRRRAARG